jgi:hypothetical protein
VAGLPESDFLAPLDGWITQRRSVAMRLKTYRDQDSSWHLDLVGLGDQPWSVDLVKESASCMLVSGFILAFVAIWIH